MTAPDRLVVEWEIGHHCRIHGRKLGNGFKAEYIRRDAFPVEELKEYLETFSGEDDDNGVPSWGVEIATRILTLLEQED